MNDTLMKKNKIKSGGVFLCVLTAYGNLYECYQHWEWRWRRL